MPPHTSIVVLTGAGISAESGIKTFRAADGLWENHRVEDVASPEGFARNPELVQRFYNERRRQILNPDIKPNRGHTALAELEEKFNGRFLLITQNIDNLHERAGSEQMIHMHGEILKMRCLICDGVFSILDDIQDDKICENCDSVGKLRPHIVWFGEMPLEMERIYQTLNSCDLFISVGTSGNVYPAAGFVQAANLAGAHTVELNLDPSATESQFKEKIYGPATEIVPRFVEKILSH